MPLVAISGNSRARQCWRWPHWITPLSRSLCVLTFDVSWLAPTTSTPSCSTPSSKSCKISSASPACLRCAPLWPARYPGLDASAFRSSGGKENRRYSCIMLLTVFWRHAISMDRSILFRLGLFFFLADCRCCIGARDLTLRLRPLLTLYRLTIYFTRAWAIMGTTFVLRFPLTIHDVIDFPGMSK